MPAQRLHLCDHRPLVGGLDHRQRIGDDHGADHRERRGQAHLKANALGQVATLLRREKVEIRRARLARIAQFTEPDVGRLRALCKGQERKAIGRTYRAGRVGPHQGVAPQHRILPGDPHAASTDLAVGDAPQIRPKQRPGRAEDLVDGVEADAADKVRVARMLAHGRFPHRIWSCDRCRDGQA